MNRSGARRVSPRMMVNLRRVLVLLLLALAPLPVAARPAWACSCAAGFDPLERAEVAFVGVVEDVDGSWTSDRVEVEFAVESVLKGDTRDSVTLVTSEQSASCGYEFVAGGRYRVYSVGGETSSCDGNELLAVGDGAGEDRTRSFWIGAALAVLAVAGALTWLVRRSPRSK